MPLRRQLVGEPLGGGEDRLVLAGRDDVDVVRRDVARPAQADLVEGVLGDRGDRPRRADAVGAHRHGDQLAVLVEHLEAERLGVLAPELEDVAHLDAARRLERAAAVAPGQGSPSRTSAASIVPSGVKSRPATRSMTWLPSTFAPVTQRVPSTIRGSTRKRIAALALLAERPGADVALDQVGVLLELRLVHRLDLERLELALEALEVDVAVAGQADGQRLLGAVGVDRAAPGRS